MEVTDGNFSEALEKSGKPVLLDFWAPWCGPCRMLSPIIDELSNEYADKGIVIGKVNVDENPFLSTRFKIRSIPTMLFIKENGDVLETVVGSRVKSEIAKKLDSLIAKDEK